MNTYNPDSKTSYFHLDKWFMFCEGEDANSWKDSIGRNQDAHEAWRDPKLVEAAYKCFDFPTCEQFQRHPVKTTGELSRDHLSYGLILFYRASRFDYFYEIIHKLKWKFNHKHSLRGMYLWTQSFKHPLWEVLYYAAKIPEMLGARLWNWFWRKWADVKPERSQDEWNMSITHNRTDRQKLASEMVVPAYALHNFAWQLKIMRNSIAKKLLQRITLPLIGKHNYIVRHILGEEVDISYVFAYKAMTGSRFTTTLDELNDRHVVVIDPPPKENNLEVDYLLAVTHDEVIEIK